ncbi:MAG: substrate-binding domain-containing protein [Rhodocyclaceae bacterium]|nr:substrate-binding domain-containing protein [Rhodocyclaceae bacterium]MDZ4214157.1 substrate-binding domain-containing protein [Rhodocyclaceae bacterium]
MKATSKWSRWLFVGLVCLASPAVLASDRPAKTKYVVAFAQDTMANDWRAAQVRDLKNTLAQYPFVELVFSDANGDTARQVQDIENFAAKGVDILITSPRDAELMREPIARVYRQGIPVILLSRRVQGEEFTHFITADNKAIAHQAAQLLAQRLKGKGKVLVLQHIPTSTPGKLRTEGFNEELKKYPGIQVVATKRADSLRSMAIQRVEEALVEKLQFDAIYAQSDSMAMGALMALKKAGRDPKKIPITGIDYISEAREAIRAGDLYASFTYPTFGKEGAEAAVQLIRGKKLDRKEVFIDSTAVTRANVEKIEPIF